MPPPAPVTVRRETVVFPTYEPHWPDRNPMFLEKRVYQGSSGRVYPLPFTDRIAEKPEPRAWDAVVVENDYLRVMILPALGGRIHRVQDKTNGYDLLYYQPVIKPALVGLAGPWISGGIEFNWPQHHRPSTFLPAEVAIERSDDGSATVWLGEHDPMARMKGMHGVRLRPGSACLEVAARVYNRSPDVQTFLWWANVATRVHERYQSFFPPDVTYVADHAKRAMSAFPRSRGRYYGVDYGARGRRGVPAGEAPRQYPPRTSPDPEGGPTYTPDDLSWYANIPVPTSYMAMGTQGNFSGGYDHGAQAGIVHVSNPHISPGKKQWTWGNHEFGYAWDRNLTDADERGEHPPYIELMAGVYTDNQPDFSFLQPGETKTWTQVWYPIREVGPVQAANEKAAVGLGVTADGSLRVAVAVTAAHRAALVRLEREGKTVAEWRQDLAPDRPLVQVAGGVSPRARLTLAVMTEDGMPLIRHEPRPTPRKPVPQAATEPPDPARVATADELYFIGLHLEQYRHATRMPEAYWREALRRDPGDARANLALGRWHLRRGEYASAETLLRASIRRSVSRNPNPADGEAYYQLGLCLRHQGFAARLDPNPARDASDLFEEAYGAFYKATWNQAWQAAGCHALAEIDALRSDWSRALAHLDLALRVNVDNLRARDLKVVALRTLGQTEAAEALLRETLALDPLDAWARRLSGEPLECDEQLRLDLAFDQARAGLFHEALATLDDARLRSAREPTEAPPVRLPDASLGARPMVEYTRAWLCAQVGDAVGERRHLVAAAREPIDHCFPSRLEEIAVLERALARRSGDARAPLYLGHLLYDRRRHAEAIRLWRRAARLEPDNAVAWRNLGIGCYNVLRRPAAAKAAYERAFRARPGDARLLYERDQLWKRMGVRADVRLGELRRHERLVRARDDLTIEFCALLNQTGSPEEARRVLAARRFQPWEGGEGQALGQHVRTHLALGRGALAAGKAAEAVRHFEAALAVPENLGEARHLLANASDIHFWLGCALAEAGERDRARRHWRSAAEFEGDFQEMSVRPFSEMTYYSALAWEKLGQRARSAGLLRKLLAYARRLARTPAKIDYFATSLPTLLLFEDDLNARQRRTAMVLEAQAQIGLRKPAAARRLLREVLRRDPSHAAAFDLLASLEGRGGNS